MESAGGSREVLPEVSEHGLKEDAIGFRDALIIGIASTAPAYSLAAVIGLVVVTVGVQAPAVLFASFIPMFFVATAFYYMNRADQDCGTTFSISHLSSEISYRTPRATKGCSSRLSQLRIPWNDQK